MPIETETKIDNGKEVRFAMTPLMSSYLNVFVAGELEFIETQNSGAQIRVGAVVDTTHSTVVMAMGCSSDHPSPRTERR